MGKSYDGITPELSHWIERQHIFFVATAPLADDGLINCSPKGMDTFRILGPREVAYLDLTGSGIETVAHSRENGRIVFMFCAFEGPPKIVRLHGTGEVYFLGSPQYDSLSSSFPAYIGSRAIVRARLTRISDSCGYAVPQYRYGGDRTTLIRWAESKGQDGLTHYRQAKNARSLNGLPGLTVVMPGSPLTIGGGTLARAMADPRSPSGPAGSLHELPPDLGHPRGTLAIVAVFGLLFGLAWLATYLFVFLERGAPHH